MQIDLYTVGYPKGRFALLIKKLHEVTSMPGQDCIGIGQALFWNYYTQDNPLTIEISDSRSADELQSLCAEFGITVVRSDKPTLRQEGS